MMLLFAQTVDSLGGWGSLVLQAGAFGLLTYIVIFSFPTYTKEVREERERREVAFTGLIDALQTKFGDRNALLRAAIELQTEKLAAKLDTHTEVVESLVDKLGSDQTGMCKFAMMLKAAGHDLSPDDIRRLFSAHQERKAREA